MLESVCVNMLSTQRASPHHYSSVCTAPNTNLKLEILIGALNTRCPQFKGAHSEQNMDPIEESSVVRPHVNASPAIEAISNMNLAAFIVAALNHKSHSRIRVTAMLFMLRRTQSSSHSFYRRQLLQLR